MDILTYTILNFGFLWPTEQETEIECGMNYKALKVCISILLYTRKFSLFLCH